MATYTYDDNEELEEEDEFGPTGAELGIEPGYSKVYDSPEFQAHIKGQRRGWVIGFVLAFVISIVAGAFVSFFGKKANPAVFVGVVIVLILCFIILGIVYAIKNAFNRNWDGVVEAKTETTKRVRHGSGDDSYYRTHSAWLIEFRTDAGKRKKYTELDSPKLYKLVEEGDRVRYHKVLPYPYEKFDKTADRAVQCSFCGALVPISEETCPRCKKYVLR